MTEGQVPTGITITLNNSDTWSQLPNAYSALGQRLARWPNAESALCSVQPTIDTSSGSQMQLQFFNPIRSRWTRATHAKRQICKRVYFRLQIISQT